MQLNKMVGIGIFFFILLIVLIMSPEVTTANDAAYDTWAAASENADMLMMGTLMPWGSPLICLSIIVTMGMSIRKMASGKVNWGEMISPLIRIVIAIVLLSFFSQIITAVNTDLASSTNAISDIVWGIVPMGAYVFLIMVCGGWDIFSAAKGKYWGKGKKSGAQTTGYAGGQP
jgi:hypothetical protein